ncbi:hypothetical protein NERG_02649 [Nematocida ausubeli]|uniref:Uncharacterized protein n=1 Tax=Nematocida ausubeli (strain ATCC PRA-371 / ERTm2) TaxID=1913371 RepID=H8ZGC8_NEMA1|nr:hypothetical protein NERG_02649 [Nematocida ausubeli]
MRVDSEEEITAVWQYPNNIRILFGVLCGMAVYSLIEYLWKVFHQRYPGIPTAIKTGTKTKSAEKEGVSNDSLINALEDPAEMSMAEKTEEKSATGKEESISGALSNSQIQDPKTADIAGIAQYSPKLEEHYKIGVECLERTEDAGSKAQLKHRHNKSQ